MKDFPYSLWVLVIYFPASRAEQELEFFPGAFYEFQGTLSQELEIQEGKWETHHQFGGA